MNTVTGLETNFPVENPPPLPSLFDSAEILNS